MTIELTEKTVLREEDECFYFLFSSTPVGHGTEIKRRNISLLFRFYRTRGGVVIFHFSFAGLLSRARAPFLRHVVMAFSLALSLSFHIQHGPYSLPPLLFTSFSRLYVSSRRVQSESFIVAAQAA